jgi:hypothetical protein
VQFAAESGQTLVGFLRGERMNVYAHPQRIRFGSGAAMVSARPHAAEFHPSSHPNP